MYSNTYKGFFKPTNPKKYKGDPTNIIYRSSWELRFMVYCDTTDEVLEWNSEEFVIPYMSPIDKKMHRYFVDFYCKIDRKTSIRKYLIEIKPKKFCSEPKKPKRITKRYLNEMKTWGINNSKWEAASKWCEKKDMKFLILTEDSLT